MKTFTVIVTETKTETTGNIEYSLGKLNKNPRVSAIKVGGVEKDYGMTVTRIEYTWETTHTVSANDKDEAVKNTYIYNLAKNVKFISVERGEDIADAKAEIIDAEELLYEMDANNVDSILVKEGFNTKSIYTREDVCIQIQKGHVVKNQAIKRNGNLGKPTATIKEGKITDISLNAGCGQSRNGLDALTERMVKGFNENDITKFKIID